MKIYIKFFTKFVKKPLKLIMKLKQLYSILNEFKNPEFMIEKTIHRKICDFNNEEFKDKKPPLDSEFFYEKMAFAFIEKGNPPLEWGKTFYKPLIGNIDPINKQWISYYPDIKNITPEMINYWEKRSKEADRPILQCRYSGLVWNFSKKIRNVKPDISIAHRFIDSIINMAHLGGDRFLKYKLERGLKLAVSIDDKKRIFSIRNAIIKYEKTYSEDDKPGTWGYSYDFLIGDRDLYHKVQLEQKQKNEIIKSLETKLKKFSAKDLNKCKPHFVEYIVTKLAPYYKDRNDKENMKRVLFTYRDSFLYGIKNNLVMSGSHWLEKVRKILFQYGLSEQAKTLESNIRFLQKQDLNYLQKFEIPIQIPPAEIGNYMSELDRRTLSEALNYIALSFISNKEEAKDIVLKTAEKHPLSAMIPQSIMDHTGRVVTTIDPIEKDLDGHIVRQISQSMNINLHFISLGLRHLKKNKSLNANTLSEHLFKSPVFTKDSHSIIKEGLIAYFNKNYIASCSILIHQIESAIRELISLSGGSIYQTYNNPREEGFKLRSLGALLRDESFIKVFEKLNPDIPDFFKILLVDKRSLNIRNSIYHGHFPANFLNEGVAIHIIHVLLILSILRKTENLHRRI